MPAPSVVTQGVAVNTNSGSAAGSLKASAHDLAALMVATDRLPNHPDILSSTTLETMETRPFPESAGARALGWQVNCQNEDCTQRLLWHNGLSGFGTSYIGKFDHFRIGADVVSGINVAIVANRGSGNTTQLAALARAIASMAQNATTTFVDYFNEDLQPTP